MLRGGLTHSPLGVSPFLPRVHTLCVSGGLRDCPTAELSDFQLVDCLSLWPLLLSPSDCGKVYQPLDFKLFVDVQVHGVHVLVIANERADFPQTAP